MSTRNYPLRHHWTEIAKIMGVSLSSQLRAYNYHGTAASFRDLLADMMFAHYPSWTDERLTRNPDEAKRFCNMVRESVGLNLPDEFILGTLTNIRKHAIKT